MHSIIHTLKDAHAETIWSCAWGRIPSPHYHTDEETEDDLNEVPLVDCIVTGSIDDLVKVWMVNSNKLSLHKTLTGHSLGVISVALNSDCTMCASSSLDSVLILWDIRKGEKIKSIMLGPIELWTISFSPDNNSIISGNHSGKINMFKVETGLLDQSFDTRGKFTLSVAYSPDGKFIASGALDGIINVFDVHNTKLTHTLEGHAMPIRSLCFSTDSKHLLTASDDGHMKIYALAEQAVVVGTVSGHASWVLSVAFSHDSKYFVSASADHTVKVWKMSDLSCVHTFKDHSDQVWCAKFNDDSSKIVSVSEDKSINIYSCPVL